MADRDFMDQAARRSVTGPEKKAVLGLTFWKLMAVFLVLGAGLVLGLIGYLGYGVVVSPPASEETAPDVPASPPPPTPASPDVPAAPDMPPASGAPEVTSGPSSPPILVERPYLDEKGVWSLADQTAPAPPPASGSSRPVESRAVRPMISTSTEVFYQDEQGVWRNTQAGGQPAASRPALGGGDLSAMSGLLSALGGGSAGGGGDLSAMSGLLSALGGGSSSGGGDLSAMSGLLSALGGGSSSGGGDLSGLIQGLGALGGQAPVPSPEDGLNRIHARPGDVGLLAGSKTGGAAPPPVAGRGLNIEGYERFDPAAAGTLKSDWEPFNDPR